MRNMKVFLEVRKSVRKREMCGNWKVDAWKSDDGVRMLKADGMCYVGRTAC